MNTSKIEALLERIATALERIAPAPTAPNYQAKLEDFGNFNWEAISCKIEGRDRFGVSTVIWQGNRYLRRSPDNAYGATIFFSRCTGRDEDGRNQYERLITFKPASEIKIQPISRKAEEILQWKSLTGI